MRLHNLVPLVAAVLAIGSFTLASEEEPTEKDHGNAHTTHARNEVGVFLGITTGGEAEGGGKENATATIGLEYRRNLSRRIGVGLLLEFAGGERRDGTIVVPATVFLGSRAELLVAAGVERSKGSEIFAGGDEFLARLGFGYRIPLVPGNVIRPEINVDFVDGEELVVVGATIGWEF